MADPATNHGGQRWKNPNGPGSTRQREQELWLRFQQYKVPVIELLKETPKEAVCQVFEKVNTGGVTLSVFELVTAAFAADDFQLRPDWEATEKRLGEHDVLGGFDATAFLSGDTIELASYFDLAIDIHHAFPKAYCERSPGHCCHSRSLRSLRRSQPPRARRKAKADKKMMDKSRRWAWATARRSEELGSPDRAPRDGQVFSGANPRGIVGGRRIDVDPPQSRVSGDCRFLSPAERFGQSDRIPPGRTGSGRWPSFKTRYRPQ